MNFPNVDNFRLFKNIPQSSQILPFDLEKMSFITERSYDYDCLIVSIIHCLNYWESRFNDLKFPHKEDIYNSICKNYLYRSKRGINHRQVGNIISKIENFEKIPNLTPELLNESMIELEEEPNNKSQEEDAREISETHSFIIKDIYPKYLSSLIHLLYFRIPLTIISIYDKARIVHGYSSIPHAALIQKIDLKTKKISLIDPDKNDKFKIIPFIFDLNEFEKIWATDNNHSIVIYPKVLSKEIEDHLKIENSQTSQKKLTDFNISK